MKQLEYENKKISSLTGEFIDPILEHNFYSNMLQETIQNVRPNLLVFSFLFLLFIIPEYFVIKDKSIFYIIFLIRILFFLISILYSFQIHYNPNSVYFFSTIYELFGLILLWSLLYFYENPNIFIHQQGLLAFILAIFLILPNRFFTKLSMSVIISVGFFYIIFKMNLFMESRYYGGLIVFTAIVILFCSLTTYRINRLHRVQFKNALALEKLSTTDTITGIHNRMKYDQELEKEITRAQRYNTFLSGIMFDLDNFKKINDKYSHLEGDKVIRKVASLIEDYIRENDQFFRWGGDEFIILLPNTDLESAINLTMRLHELIRNTDFSPLKKLTCSFGVTSLQKDDTADSFTNRLDELQYQAKMKGKDCIEADSADNIQDYSKLQKTNKRKNNKQL